MFLGSVGARDDIINGTYQLLATTRHVAKLPLPAGLVYVRNGGPLDCRSGGDHLNNVCIFCRVGYGLRAQWCIRLVPRHCRHRPARKEEDRITWMIQTMMATSTIWTMTSNSERRVSKSELHDEVHLLLDGGGRQQHQQSLPATAVIVLVVSTTYVKKGGDLPPWAGDFPPKGKNQSIWKL